MAGILTGLSAAESSASGRQQFHCGKIESGALYWFIECHFPDNSSHMQRDLAYTKTTASIPFTMYCVCLIVCLQWFLYGLAGGTRCFARGPLVKIHEGFKFEES